MPPTPQCPSRALARFFSEGNGLTSNVTGWAHRKYSLEGFETASKQLVVGWSGIY